MQLGLQAIGISPSDVDSVFDTYDADGGGFMDEDEAKEMVKGLQKIAEDAQHDFWAAERAAKNQRRDAVKKAAIIAAPLPEVVPPPAPAPPVRSKLNARSKKDKGDAPSTADVSLNLADRVGSGLKNAYEALFSTPRSVGRRKLLDEATKGKEADGLQVVATRVGARLKQLHVLRAWNHWHDCYLGERNAMATVNSVVAKLQNQFLWLGFATWVDWHELRKRNYRLVRSSIKHMLLGGLIEAMRRWQVEANLRARARLALVRLSNPKLARCFRTWHKLQMLGAIERNLKIGGVCAAFGYWIRTKCMGDA